jgi:hypothetical protein
MIISHSFPSSFADLLDDLVGDFAGCGVADAVEGAGWCC